MRRTAATFVILFFIGLVSTSTLMFFSAPVSYQSIAMVHLNPMVGV